MAADVVFYSLPALFPAISAVVSLYGLVDAPTIDSHLSLVSGILPSGAVDSRLSATKGSGLSFRFVFSLLFALWSAWPASRRLSTPSASPMPRKRSAASSV
jgi:membrane protein